MSTSEAFKRAIKKYDQEKIERVSMRVPMGKKSKIQEHAEKCGESLNAFLNRAGDETMARDKNKE